MGETQYRILFETSANPIFIAAPTGQMVELNPAWLSLFGYSREAALQKTIADLFVEPDEYDRFWQKLNGNGSVKNFEGKFITGDGRELECMLTTAARRDDQGQIAGYQGILRDITDDKRAERQLKAYNRELEQKVAERTAQLETQVNHLAAVNFITQMVASAPDTTTALETVAREMVHLFGVRSSGITLLNQARTELRVVAFYTRDQAEPSVLGTIIPLQGNPASAQVVEAGKSIVIHDPQSSQLTEASHPILRERQIECMMILPLLAKGQVIGTIGIDADQSGYEFSSDEVLLAELLAA
ncbi:MAG: PAS domain S-box protein, partial [Anaerolineae bacterium]|nr:PAS domain S-box protein [Anaerolineae bacterium]